jgi:hypothetical protein
VKLRFAWHHPGWYLLLLGYVPYLIAMMFVQRTATVNVGLCRRHRAKRKRTGLYIFLLFFLALWLGLMGTCVEIAGYENLNRGMVFACVVTFVGGIIALFGLRTVWPKRIDGELVWLKGVCPAFLDELPDFRTLLDPIPPPPDHQALNAPSPRG